MKIYEPVILRKLGLSIKFPSNILYARKSMLGVKLMSPSTIMDILALKLYIGYNRGESEVAKIIKILEENAWLQYGYSGYILETSRDKKPKQLIWSNKIQQMLEKRNL